jgi:hypothetical protein
MLLNTKVEAVTGGMVLAVELETVEADMLRVNWGFKDIGLIGLTYLLI